MTQDLGEPYLRDTVINVPFDSTILQADTVSLQHYSVGHIFGLSCTLLVTSLV